MSFFPSAISISTLFSSSLFYPSPLHFLLWTCFRKLTIFIRMIICTSSSDSARPIVRTQQKNIVIRTGRCHITPLQHIAGVAPPTLRAPSDRRSPATERAAARTSGADGDGADGSCKHSETRMLDFLHTEVTYVIT